MNAKIYKFIIKLNFGGTMDKIIKNIIVLLFFICMFQTAILAEERLVFLGMPFSQVKSDMTSTNRVVLDEKKSEEYKVIITKKNGKYFWKSRRNMELYYVQSGAFDWFFAPTSGYVKILDRKKLGEVDSPQYIFMEHMSLAFGTVTYRGAGKILAP